MVQRVSAVQERLVIDAYDIEVWRLLFVVSMVIMMMVTVISSECVCDGVILSLSFQSSLFQPSSAKMASSGSTCVSGPAKTA